MQPTTPDTQPCGGCGNENPADRCLGCRHDFNAPGAWKGKLPNPDTHCASCGEVLSQYGHCWQCEYPPLDPAQDVPAVRSTPHHIPCGQCGACAANEPCARLL